MLSRRSVHPLLLCTALLALPCLAQSLAAPVAAGQTVCAATRSDSALALTNMARAAGQRCSAEGAFSSAGTVGWSAALERVASNQATWLADLGSLVHTGPQGQRVGARAAEAGYRYLRVTENLALGQNNLGQALSAWQASESHCLNLYDQRVTEMALACVPARDGRPVWVMILGRPQ